MISVCIVSASFICVRGGIILVIIVFAFILVVIVLLCYGGPE